MYATYRISRSVTRVAFSGFGDLDPLMERDIGLGKFSGSAARQA